MKLPAHYFIIPGLFHLPESDLSFLSDAKYPCLSRILTRSKRLKSEHKNIDAVLSDQLDLPSKSKIVPLAQQFKHSENVLIATPILLKSDINSTWIQPAKASDNIKTIIDDLAEFFEQDLVVIDEIDGNFVFQFKKAKVVTHLPHYLSVLGKKIDSYQDSIRENLEWFKLLNEMQMFLHGHELNLTDTGQQVLNSLWFWGGDSLQTVKPKQSIRCDDALMQLALGQNIESSHHRLMIKLDLLKYLKLNSALQLEAFFYQLEQDLKGINLNEVCIDTADGHQFIYDRWSPIKFWKTYSSLLNVLTQNEFDYEH